jgi:hypothetical protein
LSAKYPKVVVVSIMMPVSQMKIMSFGLIDNPSLPEYFIKQLMSLLRAPQLYTYFLFYLSVIGCLDIYPQFMKNIVTAYDELQPRRLWL